MTKEFPMTNAEFSLITRASGGESRGLPSRRQRGFHRLATLCWERIGHWGYWSFTGHCGIGHWSFAPNANPLEMSRNQGICFLDGVRTRLQSPAMARIPVSFTLLAALSLAASCAAAPGKDSGSPKHLLLIGQGSDGHPPTTHEFMAGVRVLEKLLAPVPGLETKVVKA